MESYQAILSVFECHRSFALSTHINPDGDAIGSELALYSFLQELGKEVQIFNADPAPLNYEFLPFCDAIQSPEAHRGYFPQVLVILDAGVRKRIGDDLCHTLIPTEAVVNIDHHDTADLFGNYNLVETDASSTSEIVYRLIKCHGMPIGKERALCLYTGLMFDTGCFRYSNSTPIAHRIAADLIEAGDFSADEIYQRVYESIPLGKMRLLGETLKTLGITPDGKIAWLYATQQMFHETGTVPSNVEGFVNQIRSIDSVEVAIFVSELENGTSKAGLRSKTYVDVGEIAAEFGGGGHQRAAGCLIDTPCESAVAQLVASTQRRIREGV